MDSCLKKQGMTFVDRLKDKITNPIELAALRYIVSRRIKTPGLESVEIVKTALEYNILGSDEVAYLENSGQTLPEPWKYGRKAEKRLTLSAYTCKRALEEIEKSENENLVILMTGDLINAGHLSIARQAREMAGPGAHISLILDSDLLASRLKSKSLDMRPKLPLHQRLYMAAQMEDIDNVWYASYPTTADKLIFELGALYYAARKIGDVKKLGRGYFNHYDLDNQQTYKLGIPRISWETIIKFYSNGDFHQLYDQGKGKDGWKGAGSFEEFVEDHLGVIDFQPRYESDDFLITDPLFPDSDLQRVYAYMCSMLVSKSTKLTIVTSKLDPIMARLHEHQFQYYDRLNNGMTRAVGIEAVASQSSSTALYSRHPIESEAETENILILKHLQSLEAGFLAENRLFDNWVNPLRQHLAAV